MQEESTLEPITPSEPTKNRYWLKFKRRALKHLWLVRISLLLGIGVAACLLVLFFGFLFNRFGISNFFHLTSDFVFTPESQIKSKDNRTNLVILGKAGLGHDSPDLTDSIIFTSISQTEPAINLISIPRDVWIPEIRAKINTAYHYGNLKEPGGGIKLAKSLVEKITGQPIHYALVVDFSGFTEMVDIVGGVEVDVERSFVDEWYPIAGKEDDQCGGDREFKCRYETITFTAGLQKMDGATALKFVRSRQAKGEEGTDLARAKRQQKVLTAIREKVLKPSTYLSPSKMIKIWRVVKKSIETDIDSSAGAILIRKAFNGRDNLSSVILAESLLINPPISERYDYQYVFIPKGGSWQEIHNWVSCQLGINCSESTP